MRTTAIVLLAAAAGCSGSSSTSGGSPGQGVSHAADTFLSYRTGESDALQSTLFQHVDRAQTSLRGHTQLENGSWLVEEATLDPKGRLVRAVVDRAADGLREPMHIVLDAEAGSVELTTPTRNTRWTVPTDYPWVPTGLWTEPSGQSLATPVAMTVALRAVGAERVVRLVDVEHFTCFTIVADQVFVDDAEPTLVLGDDYADVEDGLPWRVHLAALGKSLDARCPGSTVAWARASCSDVAAPATRAL